MEPDIEYFKDKKILITGGGGYLGSKLAEILVHSGAKIALMDIFFNSLSERLIVDNENIKKCHIDITSKCEMENACSEIKPEYIFHFGALLFRDRNFKYYDKLYDVNVKGTLNLLEALQSIDYKGFYFSSSSEVYGSKNPNPFHETQSPFPASPYSLTKLMAENLIQTYSELHCKPYTILRLFNFFGTDMSENFFINQLIATLNKDEYFEMTGGEQKRDFMHIDDSLAAIIAICKLDKSNGEIFNICSGKGITLKELAIEIAGKLKKEHLLKIGAIPYRENEIWEMVGNNEKLKSMNPVLRFPAFKEKVKTILQG